MGNHAPKGIRWWWLGLSVLLGVVIVGCGDAGSRYQVLSFFFDGVPDPNAPKGSTTRRAGSRGGILYVHKPFADAQNEADKCNACHLNTTDIFARAQVRRDVCMECHASVKTQYRVMHGPVANNMCTFCHAPHQSVNEHLLKQPAPGVCTQCHEPELLSAHPPEHLEPKSNCVSCHSGHGGEDRSFLKTAAAAATTRPAERVPIERPATEPVTRPPEGIKGAGEVGV